MKLASFLIATLMTVTPAMAETVVVGFQPPIKKELLYQTEQRRPISGAIVSLESKRLIQFSPDGQGYILKSKLLSAKAQGAEGATIGWRMTVEPLQDVELLFQIGRDGKILDLLNKRNVIETLTRKLELKKSQNKAGSAPYQAADNVVRLLSALSPEGQVALFAAELQPLLTFANVSVDDGMGRILQTVAGAPLGRPTPVEGVVALVKQEGANVHVQERLAGDGVTVSVDYVVQSQQGLVSQMHRILRRGDQEAEENRRLIAR